MICITQLVYVKPGQELKLAEFESHAIPLIAKHKGEIIFRLKPHKSDVIAYAQEIPTKFILFNSRMRNTFRTS
jgi:hypothetical protein